jgi:Cu(I)/Ag(I) efflux system membrane fusion protein
MKIPYLGFGLWALLMAISGAPQASSFSVYPSQYDTYNRSAEGYAEQTAGHQHEKRSPAEGEAHSGHGHEQAMASQGSIPEPGGLPGTGMLNPAEHYHGSENPGLKYLCPMHPNIISDEPGRCPICGMDLVSFCTTPMGQPKADKAMLSMDGEPEQAAMSGMPPRVEGDTPPALGQAGYVCPMHPDILSDAPGRCPICGMDLVKKSGHVHTGQQDTALVVSLAPDVVQKMGVRTAAVRRGSLAQSYKTVGRVGYNEERVKQVVSRTFGWVDNLSVRTPGTTVQRGQLLLEIYSPEYLEVQKDFLLADKRDKSAGQLKKYGAREETVPARDYMRYLEVPESAINEVARNGKPRFRLPIYAPQYGVVIRHDVHKHMYLVPGQPMFTIADLSSVWVEVDLFEQQLSWLRRKLKAELQVDALPGQTLEGWVNYIHPELDPLTRTVKARLLVPNPGGVLRPNMLAGVEIFAEGKTEILTIPREALIDTGESQRVILAVGDGRFRAVEVVAGLSSQGRVEIVHGLEEGDHVVVSGQFLIDSEANLQASLRRFGAADESSGSE